MVDIELGSLFLFCQKNMSSTEAGVWITFVLTVGIAVLVAMMFYILYTVATKQWGISFGVEASRRGSPT